MSCELIRQVNAIGFQFVFRKDGFGHVAAGQL